MNVLVRGACTTGAGIARIIAEGGHIVYLEDESRELVLTALGSIESTLVHEVERGKITVETKKVVLSRIIGLVELGKAHEVDVVINVLSENDV